MADAFNKDKNKRNKSNKMTNTIKLLHQEKRGWSFIRKLNKNLDKQFETEFNQTPNVKKTKGLEPDASTRSGQYNLMTSNNSPSMT